MKLICAGLTALLMSLNTFAVTLDLEDPELQFDKTFDWESSASFAPLKIEVVQEDIRFRSGKQKVKLLKAIQILGHVINSKKFKKMVLTYVRPKSEVRGFSKNYLWTNYKERLTNEDIYKILMTGDEKMRPNTLGEMNINVKSYRSKWYNYRGRDVIGFTRPASDKRIHVNWRFYYKYTVPDMVSNLMHEWIHLLGFLHGKEAPKEEVPYVVGYIAKLIASDYIAAWAETKK